MFIDEATERALDDESLRASVEGASGAKATFAAIVLWVQSTRIVRVIGRYTIARSNLLAGGIAYTALISIFAALVIGWTVFMAVLGGNEELQTTVIETINDIIPGLIGYGDDYVISPSSLVLNSAVNLVSIATALALLWSALALMGALRMSIRQVFGIAAIPENFLLQKGRDLVGFAIFALVVLLTSVLSIGVNSIGTAFFDFVGIEGSVSKWLIRIGSVAVTLLMDMLLYVMVIRFVAGAKPLRKDLLLGAALGAVASGAIRYLGTAVISIPNSPVFTSLATVGTLLIFVNLMARVSLYVSAFIANPPATVKPDDPAEVHFYERPNFVTLSAPETLEWDFQPVTGAVIPDPSLNPNAPPPPEPEPEPVPRWGGLIGKCQTLRMERLERKLDRARESYYR